MQLTYLWPLFGLVLIPGIILLYLLKQKAEDQKVSSLYLWREAYKNMESSSPWERFKNQILMYLQIAAVLLFILAFCMPILSAHKNESEKQVYVVDCTGSMNAIYDGSDTRLETAKKDLLKKISRLPEKTKVTILTVGKKVTTQCLNEEDPEELKKAVKSITQTDYAGNAQNAVNEVAAMTEGWKETTIVFYSDEALSLGSLQADVISLNSTGENASLDYVSHTFHSDGTAAILASVTNWGTKDYEGEINLYFGEKMVSIESCHLKPGETGAVYFENLDSGQVKKAQENEEIITCELNSKDALEHDNKAYDTLEETKEAKVLLVSRQNTFLEQMLSLFEQMTVYKTIDVEEINEKEAYDLYVFDGQVPDRLPSTGNCLFVAPDEEIVDSDGKTVLVEKGIHTKKGTWVMMQDDDVTEHLEGFEFGVNEYWQMSVPKFSKSFLITEDGKKASVGFYGSDGTRNIGVLGFDLHQSDLVLQTEYPVMMYQLLEKLTTRKFIPNPVVTAGEEVTVYPSLEGTFRVTDPEENEGELVDNGVSKTYGDTAYAGIYHISDGQGESKSFGVNFPASSESCIDRSGENNTGKEQGGSTQAKSEAQLAAKTSIPIRPVLLGMILVLLLAEWIIYVRQR
ncbi:MAG: BatA domain-containing protein [Clostridiales bacterium]|nr:BatA domain-containing protein [Clostridiales bacterium]